MVKINGYDIRVKWGAFLEKGAYASLLGKSGIKDYIENSNPLIDGVQVMLPVSGAKIEPNETSFVIIIIGQNRSDALNKFFSMRSELEKGAFTLYSNTLNKTFRLQYKGSSRIYDLGRVIKMHVDVLEPNPKNR